MFIVKHSVDTKASPKQIWRIWEDAENWKTWDEQIEFSGIDGPFQTGTTGFTKFRGTPLFKTRLTLVEPYQLVVQETYLTFAKVVSTQSMSQAAGITRVTFQVEIRGLLSFFYGCMIRGSIRKKIPLEMEEMLKRLPNG
jgi:Polyketide cyclase / dehydrase and lipid transport